MRTLSSRFSPMKTGVPGDIPALILRLWFGVFLFVVFSIVTEISRC